MKRIVRLALIALLTLAVLLAAASAAIYSLLGSTPGTAWLLAHVPGLSVDAPQGALLGDFAARSVTWQGGGDRIRLTGLRWQGLRASWRHLRIDHLQADTLELAFAPSTSPTTTPSTSPTDLRLPLDVDISDLRLTTLIDQGQPLVTDLVAQLHLGRERHALQLASLRWQRLRLQGTADLGASAPLPLQAHVALSGEAPSADLPAWQGTLELQGPLAALQAQGRIEAASQHLRLQARLAPFGDWPLAALDAEAQDFDLAALFHEAPRTALTGQARLGTRATAGSAPQLDLQLQLRNALAGRWDERLLPVRSLTLELGGGAPTSAGPHHLVMRALQLELGTRTQAAGTLGGTGQAQEDGRWQLDARLAALQPAMLDQALAALRLDGNVQLAGTPDGAYTIDADIAQRTAPTAALKLKARLLPGAAGEHALDISEARLAAGPGTATARGTARLDAQRWAVTAKLAAAHFDIRHFVPGAPDSAWARGDHALNLTGSLDVSGVRAALADPLAHWPQGQAHVELQPSHVAGVPVQGVIDLHDRQGHAQLDLGGNRVGIDAHAESADLDAQLDLDAPALAQLAAVSSLVGHRLGGAAQGRVRVQRHGETAPWQTEGELALNAFSLDDVLRVDQAQLRWQGTAALDAPLTLSATLEKAQSNAHQLDHAELNVRGTPRAHQLTLAAQAAGHALTLALDGRTDLAGQRWTAHVARVESPGLAAATDVDLSVAFDAHGQPTAAMLGPGRVRFGDATVSWQTAHWVAPLHDGAPADVALDLALEPLDVAPQLARLQPDMGWGGDLRVSGRASLRTLPQASADIHLERASGDLSLRDDRGTHALGLKRVAIAATQHHEHWALTADFDGSDWGQLSAQANIASPQLVPARDAALSGRLDARVADLASLGAWLPVGWRLGGTLTAGVSLGGSANAPQVRGQLVGSGLAARNRLLGVDVHDGRLSIELDGDQARLTQLEAQAGAGRVSATGSARLGAAPQAQLQLQAQQLTLLQRVDRRLVVSGTAGLQLSGDSLQLDGKLRVDSGLFDFSHADAPALSSDVYVLRPGDDTGAPPPPAASKRKTRVALSIDLGDSLRLRGHGFDAQLAGTLQLDEDGEQKDSGPRLKGRVRTEGGHYAAYGQKLDVTRGIVTFDGPYDNPRLDILALRPDLDQAVGVAIDGTAQSPQVRLYSDPDMSDTDKLSWLLLGRASDGLGRTDVALLQRAAVALLSGEGESPSSKLASRLGLDQLTLRQSDDSTHDTIVGIGHQLSKAWYVGYERGLNSTTGSWQLIYRLAQRLTVRAQTGDDNAVELIWQWRSKPPSPSASRAEP